MIFSDDFNQEIPYFSIRNALLCRLHLRHTQTSPDTNINHENTRLRRGCGGASEKKKARKLSLDKIYSMYRMGEAALLAP